MNEIIYTGNSKPKCIPNEKKYVTVILVMRVCYFFKCRQKILHFTYVIF